MKKILILGFGSIFLFSCASEDKITTLQRELLSLRQEVNELKDRTNGNTKNIKNINARLDKLSRKVAENSADIEKLKMGGRAPTSSSTPPQKIKKEGKEKVIVPQNDKQLYQYALDLYFKGNIEESRKAFAELLEKYPDSGLYGNVIFWAGQTFYTEKKYKDAIDIWEMFLKKCDERKVKKCNKYTDVMLKLGYSYIELGNVKKGKQYLQDLIKKYPDSEAASLAKKKLEVLK